MNGKTDSRVESGRATGPVDRPLPSAERARILTRERVSFFVHSWGSPASLLDMPTFVLWVKAELEGVKSLSFPFPSTTWTFDVQQAAGSETREGVVMDPEEARRTATAGVLLPPLHSVVPHARGHLQRMCLRRGAAGASADQRSPWQGEC